MIATIPRKFLVSIATLHLLMAPAMAGPVVTGADHYALPEGQTITLTGSGLTGASAAHLFWTFADFPAAVTPVNDSTLQVVMPNVAQDIRNHLLLVETPTGSTFGIPSSFSEHTANGGAPPSSPPFSPRVIVVRAGATLSGTVSADLVYVETGGVYRVAGNGVRLIAAENGAVIDFEGVSSLSSCRYFRSPDTVLIGTLPTGLTTRLLTPIDASFGIETFTVGYPVNITNAGGGTVSRVPDQAYYRINSDVSLTATPDENFMFSGWSGNVSSSENPTSVRIGTSALNITATFSPGWLLDLINVPGVAVTVSPSGAIHADGTSLSLTATVESGYEFLGWGGDLYRTDPTNAFNITGNTTALPIVRPVGHELLPQLSGADHYALPEGQTITLSGNGLGGANAAQLLWANFSFPAAVSPVSDSTLHVVMPNVAQDIRNHLLLVETPIGSTFGIPAVFSEHTANGGAPPPSSPFNTARVIVVRAGATLSGSFSTDLVFVETGGIYQVDGSNPQLIAAENGAVIDFNGVSSLSSCRFFRSPGTMVVGATPTGVTSRHLTPIRASFNIETFTVGYPVNISTIGGGTVTRSPDQTYYRSSSAVTLTALPDEGRVFSGWSGSASELENPLEIRVANAPLNITATFSQGWVLDVIEVPGVTVTASPSESTHVNGTSVTLTATVEAGYEFLGWGGDLSGPASTHIFNITDHTTALPIVRPVGHDLLPRLTAADRYVLPEGETITFSGSGLAGANAAQLFWAISGFPATVNSVDDSSLQVVMPNVAQEFRDHLLLVETPTGSTFGIPSVFSEHTANGGAPSPASPFNGARVIVVRAGATLSGSFSTDLVFVETGGIYQVAGNSPGIIAAENGAVIDFQGVSSLTARRFFRSPDTVVIGTIPAGMNSRLLTPLRASFGIGTFKVGYPLNLIIEGPGAVTVDPVKDFYAVNEQITLTATPNEGAFFIRWIGPLSGNTNPGTFSIRSGIPQVARFSTAPDYFTVWRLEHFTIEELADVNISAMSADPDGDSLTNAAEYAFGSDPRAADAKSQIRAGTKVVDGETIFTASYKRPKNALDVSYVARISTDNITWTANGDGTGTLYSEEISVEDLDAETEEVTLQLYPGSAPPKTFFLRIDALIFD